MTIEFCTCGGMFIPTSFGKKCRTCGREESGKVSAKMTHVQNKGGIIIFENNAPDLPTTERTCEECGHGEAYFWLIQTRSSDEPPTQFFRCTACKHTWREYK